MFLVSSQVSRVKKRFEGTTFVTNGRGELSRLNPSQAWLKSRGALGLPNPVVELDYHIDCTLELEDPCVVFPPASASAK